MIQISLHRAAGKRLLHMLGCMLISLCTLPVSAQPAAGDPFSNLNGPLRIDWQVEVIAFIHLRPDEAFRDRQDLNDYRDLPALPALLTAAEPEPPENAAAFSRPPGTTNDAAGEAADNPEPPFATEAMASAWRRIAGEYQRIGYFQWRQPPGRGALRRLHDDQPLNADDSLSLGPHYEFDGRIRITTNTIGYANLQLTHRTPLLINPGFPNRLNRDTPPGQLWRTLTLEQQRRIQPGRLEYFDSAGLGLLVLISPPPEPDESSEEFSQ